MLLGSRFFTVLRLPGSALTNMDGYGVVLSMAGHYVSSMASITQKLTAEGFGLPGGLHHPAGCCESAAGCSSGGSGAVFPGLCSEQSGGSFLKAPFRGGLL